MKFNRKCGDKRHNELEPALSLRFVLAECTVCKLTDTLLFTHLAMMVVTNWWKMWCTSFMCTCIMKLAFCPFCIFTTSVTVWACG